MQAKSIQTAKTQLKALSSFIPKYESDALKDLLKGEESSYFCGLIDEIAQKIENMPSTGETDEQGENALAILHYFSPYGDFYITEKDINNDQQQAFGLARICDVEYGYISLPYLFSSPISAELDLYFEPKPVGELKKHLEKEMGY